MKSIVTLLLSFFLFFGLRGQENLKTLTIEPVKFNRITYAYINIDVSDTFKLEVYDPLGKLIITIFENKFLDDK
jgi:hypothetical protein